MAEQYRFWLTFGGLDMSALPLWRQVGAADKRQLNPCAGLVLYLSSPLLS